MEQRRLVYSTSAGRIEHDDRSAAKTPAPPGDGVIRVSRERGGRGGKTVTVIRGLPQDAAFRALAADLRRLCGAGGTVRDGVIELQGDHRERIAEHLRGLGHRVRLAGG